MLAEETWDESVPMMAGNLYTESRQEGISSNRLEFFIVFSSLSIGKMVCPKTIK